MVQSSVIYNLSFHAYVALNDSMLYTLLASHQVGSFCQFKNQRTAFFSIFDCKNSLNAGVTIHALWLPLPQSQQVIICMASIQDACVLDLHIARVGLEVGLVGACIFQSKRGWDESLGSHCRTPLPPSKNKIKNIEVDKFCGGILIIQLLAFLYRHLPIQETDTIVHVPWVLESEILCQDN